MISQAATKIENIGVNILNQSITARFQEQAHELRRSRVAIQCLDSTITYKELNGWANQIARAIIEKRGVGAEPIALLFETGAEAIAAMLGVLKGRKVLRPVRYVLARSHRLNSILVDSQTELILSDSSQFQATGLEHPGLESGRF